MKTLEQIIEKIKHSLITSSGINYIIDDILPDLEVVQKEQNEKIESLKNKIEELYEFINKTDRDLILKIETLEKELELMQEKYKNRLCEEIIKENK